MWAIMAAPRQACGVLLYMYRATQLWYAIRNSPREHGLINHHHSHFERAIRGRQSCPNSGPAAGSHAWPRRRHRSRAAKLPHRFVPSETPRRPLIARRTRLLNPLACAPSLLCNAVLHPNIGCYGCGLQSLPRAVVSTGTAVPIACRVQRTNRAAIRALPLQQCMHTGIRQAVARVRICERTGKYSETLLVHGTCEVQSIARTFSLVQKQPSMNPCHGPDACQNKYDHPCFTARCHGDRCAVDVEALSS
jgi:hypothetical protein